MSEDVLSITIAKMRNALLPSVPSRLHCYGNNEAKMENLKVPMQMNDLIHFHSNGISMGSKIFNNGSQLGNGGNIMSIQSHSLIDDYNRHYPVSLQSNYSNIKDISQQSLMLSKKQSISQHEEGRGNKRKRPYEFTDNSMSPLREMIHHQKIQVPISEPKWHQAIEDSRDIHAHKLQMPVRGRQKLSEKITSLQKLVSPYGKTDTASVLHEASLYIKLLQEQIQNLYQMLSFSYNTVKTIHAQGCGEKQVDLRSKGLCLVPISITQKVAMEDQLVHHDSASRRINVLPRNF
ncbi:hypothetical protein L6164_008889 [Bauhinia variegata]|uniref:Uncharacterized protein n=1 Tax=Bauhinia variegata TaxID=167791 RepID=A0ACB9PH98_BAUVA|nr:hypothetical protein L6164_008889 [Bauhinia variegata]